MKVIAAGADDRHAGEVDGGGHVGPEGGRPRLRHRRHQYASDIRRPGMLFGKVLRPPAFKAKLDVGGHEGRPRRCRA